MFISSIPLQPALRATAIAVAAPLGLYCIFLGLGSTPFFQRQYGDVSQGGWDWTLDF